MRLPTFGDSLPNIQLEYKISDAETAAIESRHAWLDETHYDPNLFISHSSQVLTPSGDPLLILIKGRIATDLTVAAKPHLRKIATNLVIGGFRGSAAGGLAPERRQDGSLTGQYRVPDNEYLRGARDGIIGFSDRSNRADYCRMTAYTQANVDEYFRLLPYFQAVDSIYRDYAPEKYAAQQEFVREVDPHWLIEGTNFSTATQNLNYRTSAHRDSGDCRAGMGVITINRSGSLYGGALCFPEYRCAVRVEEGDVLLANVHALHGNLPMLADSTAERLASVFYVRERLTDCGTLAQEHARYEALYPR
jgi:Oxygenase domain of the 2OGFeDO superfamily